LLSEQSLAIPQGVQASGKELRSIATRDGWFMKLTIYHALAEKLGRVPSNEELKAEVNRINHPRLKPTKNNFAAPPREGRFMTMLEYKCLNVAMCERCGKPIKRGRFCAGIMCGRDRKTTKILQAQFNHAEGCTCTDCQFGIVQNQ
jgi:hypothetical protein